MLGRHPYMAPKYNMPTSQPLYVQGTHLLQQIIGTLLFYPRAIDNSMQVALGALVAARERGTDQTMDAPIQLLNHPDAAVR
jgi:hypothetical protein